MLRIDYLENSQEALLSTDEKSGAWNSVRRLCESQTERVLNRSATCLSLPWWSFLKCRSGIGTILVSNGLRPDFTENAKGQLVAAKRRREAYEAAKTAAGVPANELREHLASAGFTRALTQEQLRNIMKLASLPAAASFSVPGAGKTTEALASYFYKRTPETRLLVVAPKNAFAPWEEQLSLCAPESSLQMIRLRGGQEAIKQILDEDPMAVLISYQQLLNVQHEVAKYMTRNPTLMILDESHRIKSGQEGAWGRAVLGLSHLPEAKLILTGTPLPNSLSDLSSQFNFLYPEIRVDDANVSQAILPIYVRTTKSELGLRPPSTYLVPVPLAPAQRELYELLRSETARQLASGLSARDRRNFRSIGRSVMRLLQVCSNPALLAGVPFPHPDLLRDVLDEGDSPKMRYACDRARQLADKGQKTLIWSGFVQNVETIAERLSDLGADYIHGGVEAGDEQDVDTREAKIKRFHEDSDAWVLVANPAAASESISLHTVCHHAVYVDRNYNAGQYLQSQDRIHRLGLPPDIETKIDILSAPDSIDEPVHRRLINKIGVMATVLDDSSLRPEVVSVDEEDELGLNQDDIVDLLRHLRGENTS